MQIGVMCLQEVSNLFKVEFGRILQKLRTNSNYGKLNISEIRRILEESSVEAIQQILKMIPDTQFQSQFNAKTHAAKPTFVLKLPRSLEFIAKPETD